MWHEKKSYHIKTNVFGEKGDGIQLVFMMIRHPLNVSINNIRFSYTLNLWPTRTPYLFPHGKIFEGPVEETKIEQKYSSASVLI